MNCFSTSLTSSRARRVHQLYAFVWSTGVANRCPENVSRGRQCANDCQCGWQNIMRLCRAQLVPQQIPWATSDALEIWLQRIEPGESSNETALVGIALSCTTSLRTLALISLSDVDSECHQDPCIDAVITHGAPEDEVDFLGFCYSWMVQVEILFGGTPLPTGTGLAVLPALSSLEVLECTKLVSWDLVCLPNLRSLSTAIDTEMSFSGMSDMKGLQPHVAARPLALDSLTVDIETAVLVANINPELQERYIFSRYDSCQIFRL
ncbi:hypothetical protein CC86DRAFT_76522 [Ophiobolus disseminans]|uniref:Uncharacterized protein n=1 Tax=Ophiobolus disseminans TaxID=1469910 RepID=A0A6A6ZQQ7_9PLEO|nr:hypothetical protein CC86DRAFT_76522 [Ophiobolus disseminans]